MSRSAKSLVSLGLINCPGVDGKGLMSLGAENSVCRYTLQDLHLGLDMAKSTNFFASSTIHDYGDREYLLHLKCVTASANFEEKWDDNFSTPPRR